MRRAQLPDPMIGFRLLLALALSLAVAGVGAAEPDRPAVIGRLIEAEFALQAGDLDAAARHYLAAAELAEDAALAARAAAVALAGPDRRLAQRALARWRALAPDDPQLLGQSLALALRDGEHETAMEVARALLQRPDENGWPLLLRTLAEAEGDARIIARAVLADLPAESAMPADIRAWLAFAGLARRWGDTLTAGRLVDHALARFPDEASAKLLQASRQRERGDAAGARLALIGILESPGPLPQNLRRAAARELAEAGDPVRAAQLLARGEQAAEDWPLRARWLVAAGDVPALQAFHQELIAQTDARLPLRPLLLGHVNEALQRWAEAERWYRRVEGEGADLAGLRLVHVLLRQSRDVEAIALLRKMQEAEEIDGERLREAYLMEAELHERAGRDGEAMAALDRGLGVLEDDPELLYARALQHERRDRVAQALADLRRILLDDPDSVPALNAYGYTVLERRGDLVEAEPYLLRALRLAPDSPAVLDSVGWLRFRQGRPEEALPLLQRAWARQPDPEVGAHLGEVLWSLNRQDEARQVWEAVAKRDPEHPVLRRTLERLRP